MCAFHTVAAAVAVAVSAYVYFFFNELYVHSSECDTAIEWINGPLSVLLHKKAHIQAVVVVAAMVDANALLFFLLCVNAIFHEMYEFR